MYMYICVCILAELSLLIKGKMSVIYMSIN